MDCIVKIRVGGGQVTTTVKGVASTTEALRICLARMFEAGLMKRNDECVSTVRVIPDCATPAQRGLVGALACHAWLALAPWVVTMLQEHPYRVIVALGFMIFMALWGTLAWLDWSPKESRAQDRMKPISWHEASGMPAPGVVNPLLVPPPGAASLTDGRDR